MIGKQPAVLADLDAFTDDLNLVQAFNDVEAGRAAAHRQSHDSIHDAAKRTRDDLNEMVDKRWSDVEALVILPPNWQLTAESIKLTKLKRRVVAATLLKEDEVTVSTWPNGQEGWVPLQKRLIAVLDLLETAGLFILRHGTVEDYYDEPANQKDKLRLAYDESDAIAAGPDTAKKRHDVALRAIRHVAAVAPIDESAAVAKAFLAVVAPALDELRRNPSATTADLQAATHHARDVTGLFEIARVDEAPGPGVEVRLMALVLDVVGFPIRVGKDDNINQVAQGRIKNRS
jgi:hypothetical protein